MEKRFADFKRDAATLYEAARDECKEIAVLTLAAALGHAYHAGAQDVLEKQLLAATPVAAPTQ
jgi:hypothetical protein